MFKSFGLMNGALEVLILRTNDWCFGCLRPSDLWPVLWRFKKFGLSGADWLGEGRLEGLELEYYLHDIDIQAEFV